MSDTLEQSFQWCRSFALQSGSSFVRTFPLLRPEKAKSMYAVYTFARIVDDLGDGGHQNRRSQLEPWRSWLASVGSRHLTGESILQQNLRPAFEHSIERFSIPLAWFEQLLDGIESDLIDQRCFKDWSDLEHYCFQVAGTMGLVCIKIWGGCVDSLRERAEACGVAFQLTNILRDVRDDALRRRIYLPQDELNRFGVDPDSWLQLRPTGNWQNLLRTCATKAIERFECARTMGLELEFDGQRMFSLMWHSYLNLLREIVRDFPNSFQERNLRVSSWKKLSDGVIHFLAPLYLAKRPLHQPIDISAMFPKLADSAGIDACTNPQSDSVAAKVMKVMP